MATKVILPKMGANMKEGTIGKWFKKENDIIKKGEPLFELITDKATFEIVAEEEGILKKIFFQEEKSAPVAALIAIIAKKNEDINKFLKDVFLESKKNNQLKTSSLDQPLIKTKKITERSVKASPIVKKLAQKYNFDLLSVTGTGPGGRIIEKDIQELLKKEKIIILGAGVSGEVVLDILKTDSNKIVVGFLDDFQSVGKIINGVPVLGNFEKVFSLFKENFFDKVIISIGLNLLAKKHWHNQLKRMKIPLINAIHPKAIIDEGVQIGEGNIICSNAHIGYLSIIGNNNFIASNVNIDHHNKVGSFCLIAPSSSTAGNVKIGDLCSIGLGVIIEYRIKIGNNVSIASGSTVVYDIPDNHEIKMHFSKENRPTFKKSPYSFTLVGKK